MPPTEVKLLRPSGAGKLGGRRGAPTAPRDGTPGVHAAGPRLAGCSAIKEGFGVETEASHVPGRLGVGILAGLLLRVF